MIIIPAMKEKVTTVSSGSYLCAVGSNSRTEMMIIIPATTPNRTAYMLSEKELAKMMYPNTAATGSESPDRTAHQKARQRLPVA